MAGISAKGQFYWRSPLLVAGIGFFVFTAIATCQADTFLFLMVFIVAPALLVVSIGWLIYVVIRRRRLREALATLVVLWTLAVSFFLYNREHPFAIRETARWILWSREYEHQVLIQPASADGDLKHVVWDSSGFAGVANDTAYLVYDPTDALSASASGNQATKMSGVPCTARAVRRLESQWYAVLFFTDQTWGECN
jgi:hypothetical protein